MWGKRKQTTEAWKDREGAWAEGMDERSNKIR